MKISFIIPCFNTSEYIARCLDSIYSSFKDDSCLFEVICIDDCSTDNTLNVLYRESQKHIGLSIVKNAENLGCGGARNVGISKATGDYIWFVDADDRIIPENVSNLINLAYSHQSDILCFNYRDIYSDHIREVSVFEECNPTCGINFILKTFGNTLANNIGFVWRFIYKRKFIIDNNLFFEPKVCWEDTKYMPQALILASKVESTSTICYEHFHNEDSVCSKFGKSYSGHLLYELIFCAGRDLMELSLSTNNVCISRQLRDCAKTEYFNYFPIYLCRETKKERIAFYKKVYDNRDAVSYAKQYMKALPSLLLLPVLGPKCSDIIAFFYKFTHK